MVRESSELSLSWDGGAVFSFDAGALCLELLTTGGWAPRADYEVLREPEDLTRWLGTCRLRLPGVRVAAPELAHALRLRAAVWAVTLATIGGRQLPDPAVGVVNELAAPAPPVPVLGPGGRGWTSVVTGEQAISAIARDAVDLYGGPYATRVRECAARDCALVFVDLSRPGKRRWCAMRRCGNRAKQRTRHARR